MTLLPVTLRAYKGRMFSFAVRWVHVMAHLLLHRVHIMTTFAVHMLWPHSL